MDLFDAIMSGDADRVKISILRQKTDFSKVNQYGNTLLYEACESGSLKIVEMLLAAGADPRKGGFSGSPLHAAIKSESYEIVARLISENIDLNVLDSAELTALMSASSSGNLGLVKLLVSAGADPSILSANSGFALLFAANEGHQEVFNYLYELTPQHLCKDAENILEQSLRKSENHHSELDQIFLNAVNEGSIDKLREAIKLGADFNSKGKQSGESALHFATQREYINMIEILIDIGIDVDTQDDDGNTPLMNAVLLNRIDAVKTLLEFNANVEIQNIEGDTALIIDVDFNENPDIAYLLCKHSKNIDVKNNAGFNALELARINKRIELIEYLESLN
jgi:uncharacterized protein